MNLAMRSGVVGLFWGVWFVATSPLGDGAVDGALRAVVSCEPAAMKVGERARIVVSIESPFAVDEWTLQPPSTPGRIGSLLLSGPPRFSSDRQSCVFDVIPTLPESITLPSFRIGFSPPDDRVVLTEPHRVEVRGQLPTDQPLVLRDAIPLRPIGGGASWSLRIATVIVIVLATWIWRRLRRSAPAAARRNTSIPARVELADHVAELAKLIEAGSQGATSPQAVALEMATLLRQFGTARGGRSWNQCTTEEVLERTAGEWDDVGASLCRDVLFAADEVKYAGRTPPLEASLQTASRLIVWMSGAEGKR